MARDVLLPALLAGSICISLVTRHEAKCSGLRALTGRGQGGNWLAKVVFLLPVVCAPVKQLSSGWCESHLEWRRLSNPLTAQTFAEVALSHLQKWELPAEGLPALEFLI